MRRAAGHADLLAGFALLLALDAIFLLDAGGFWRVAVGLPALLFAPGYALLSLLFPARAPEDDTKGAADEMPDALSRIGLGVGLSAVLVILIGLVLNFTPAGIRAGPTLLALTLLTAAFSLLAWRRRERRIAHAPRPAALRARILAAWSGMRASERALAGLAVLLALATFGAIAAAVLTSPASEPYTELYALGPDGSPRSAGTLTLEAGEDAALRVVLVNREGADIRYHLRLLVAQGEEDVWSEAASLETLLASDASSEESVAFRAPDEPGSYRLLLELRREGDVDAHRSLLLRARVAL